MRLCNPILLQRYNLCFQYNILCPRNHRRILPNSNPLFYGHRNLEWVYIKNMPVPLIHRTILLHIIYDMAAFFFFLTHGRGKDYIRAKISALKEMPRVLKERRRIQNNKSVHNNYIWNLFERESLFPRFFLRLKK